MKGIEYFPVLGEIKYMKRIGKCDTSKMSMEEFLHFSQQKVNAVVYHTITGIASVFLASIGMIKGLEYLAR